MNPRTSRQLEKRELHSEGIPQNYTAFPLSIQQETTCTQGKNYSKEYKYKDINMLNIKRTEKDVSYLTLVKRKLKWLRLQREKYYQGQRRSFHMKKSFHTLRVQKNP